jgi:hypothetical protein
LGFDIHRKFSKVTARDGRGKIAWRQRLEHADRPRVYRGGPRACRVAYVCWKKQVDYTAEPLAWRPSKDSSGRRCEGSVGQSNVSSGLGQPDPLVAAAVVGRLQSDT